MAGYRWLSSVVILTASLAGCGSGAGNNGGGQPPPAAPALTAIAPSTTTVGASAITLTLYGSNFDSSFAAVQWNGNMLSSTWLSASEMTATIPASDLASIGSGQVTVNQGLEGGVSNSQTFAITAGPAATTWVRTVAGIATPQDIVWDATHGNLYVSVGSTDPVIPNTIVAVNPVTGVASTPVAAGDNPDILSISSNSSYLWVGLDGSNAVQRFLLPDFQRMSPFRYP